MVQKRPKGYYTKGNVGSREARVRAGLKQVFSPRNIGKEAINAVLMSPGGRGLKAAKIAAKTSSKVARAIAVESAGKKAKAPFGTYRKPSPNRRPRLRDTDDTPRKTTVRQIVGPKTKSGKMIEKKYPAKTNTQPPTRTKTEPKAKFDPSQPITYSRNLPANPRLRNVELKRRAKAKAEYKATRERQAKLAAERAKKVKPETAELRPSQPTIESRLLSRSESIPITSRNQAGTDRIPTAELKRYAKLLRETTAKSPNVSPAQIASGRSRAVTPTAERRAAAIKAARNRAVAKAKARGMTDAQIKQMIERARREAAAIAKKAK
jgi:hypothetical protein